VSDLPIHAVLPDLLDALRMHSGAVLVAPPGAGKTTAVAPALLDQPWSNGTVILTSPRRVAARAAAERMAQALGEKPGETIGYLTRLDTKRSARTRVLVMTEAIFVNTVLADPELAGVSAVLFDEAHERHLDSDLGLALALESRAVLREDLRVLVMSATIDGARFRTLLGDDARMIESAGRAHPLQIEWLGAMPQIPVEDAVAKAIGTAWREQAGDILAFLPGVREIERTRERLEGRLPNALVLPLHGQVDPAGQRALRSGAIPRGVGGSCWQLPSPRHRSRSTASRSSSMPACPAARNSTARPGPRGWSHIARAKRLPRSGQAAPRGRARVSPTGYGKKPATRAVPHSIRPKWKPPILLLWCWRWRNGARAIPANWHGSIRRLPLRSPQHAAHWQHWGHSMPKGALPRREASSPSSLSTRRERRACCSVPNTA